MIEKLKKCGSSGGNPSGSHSRTCQVNDGLAPSTLLASILNNDIIQLNLIRSELVGDKKNAGWLVDSAKRERVEGSDQSIRPPSFPVRNSYGMTG